MRIVKLYILIAITLAAVCASIACSTAQRSSALLPPAQANAPILTASSTPPPPPAAAPKPATPPQAEAQPKPDPVADLIAEAEKEYQTGQDNYKAGNREAAQQNFDNALNLLQNSPFAVTSDARLQEEFDHVLDGVNSLEMQALREADSSTDQKSEPAPIDETNEVAFPVDPGIKAKAEAEVKATHSDLPLMMTDQVASFINYFSKPRGRGILEHALTRGGRYHDMIERVLREEGVPEDLIYLAQAESGFHPTALSRAGARGMWQFMGSRARAYDLHRDRWVDERQDPEKSTRAAAHHLKDLYNEFGDWYLAMAAYNSGPGTVLNAVKRTGYADFWELYKRNVLPRETRNYVPIILAVTIMAKNPAQYGLDEVVPDEPIPYDSLKVNYSVNLRLVAECLGTSTETLQDLNPSLLRLTTPAGYPFELHLPAGTKDQYLGAIASIPPDMRVWWRYHKVASGETLGSIARSYHASPHAIAQANHLDVNDSLPTETGLIIPLAPGKRAASEGGSYARHATPYKVRKGDTVLSVAENFGVPPAMVRRWNQLKGDSLAGRRVLYVHLPVTARVDSTRVAVASKSKPTKALPAKDDKVPVHHKVRPGETLYSIANYYKTTVATLKHDNGNLAVLRPGMILLVREP
jgi:membrane-bound lytic murein transglycosylase D